MKKSARTYKKPTTTYAPYSDKIAQYDLLKSIAIDAVCSTEQWAKIVKKTTCKAPDPQSKFAYALAGFNDVLDYYAMEVPGTLKSLIIESAVMQISEKGTGFLSTFSLLDGTGLNDEPPSPFDNPDKQP